MEHKTDRCGGFSGRINSIPRMKNADRDKLNLASRRSTGTIAHEKQIIIGFAKYSLLYRVLRNVVSALRVQLNV